MGGGRCDFSDSGKSPLLCKERRNRRNVKALIENDKVRISYTWLNVGKVLIDETCNTHGVGQVELEYEMLIGSHRVGKSLDNIVCVVVFN